MQLQQIPFYYPINSSVIQAAAAAAGVGPPQNIMISSGGSSGGPGTSGPHSIYYQGVYPGKNNKTIFFFSIEFL
jgi:hypothetical protein